MENNNIILDDFEIQCLEIISEILSEETIRYNKTEKILYVYTSFWAFLQISKLKKGYYIQVNWDFDLSKYNNILLCEELAREKRIYISTPNDLIKIKDYIIDESNKCMDSWEDYKNSVLLSSAKKREREYESSTIIFGEIKKEPINSVIQIASETKTSSENKRVHKGKSQIELLDDYTVIDIETTGLSPSYNEIIEIAAIKVYNNAIVDKFSTLIKPRNKIDSFITILTGITNEMVENA